MGERGVARSDHKLRAAHEAVKRRSSRLTLRRQRLDEGQRAIHASAHAQPLPGAYAAGAWLHQPDAGNGRHS